jgi:hypothetical protein
MWRGEHALNVVCDADYDLILLDSASAEECIETAARTIAEIEQRTEGENP